MAASTATVICHDEGKADRFSPVSARQLLPDNQKQPLRAPRRAICSACDHVR